MPLSKRSPILGPLLKLPGQKLDEDLQDFLEDHLLAPIMVLVMIAAMCLVEWAGYLKHSPRKAELAQAASKSVPIRDAESVYPAHHHQNVPANPQ